MSTPVSTGVGSRDSRTTSTARNHDHSTPERRSTETKASFKTTEFMAYVAVLVGVLIAGAMVDDGAGAFGAEKVWLYATILTVGYMVSRGLAKAGSRDPYTYDRDNG